ncbi:MAG: HEAT repeat domain-containing protein [Pirellulales bacterium]
MREVSSLFLSLVVAAAGSGAARADVVELKNGGKIHGEIANAGDKAAASYEITTDGGGRMTIPRSEVVRVVSQTQKQEQYHRRAQAAADTVDAHWQLAQWCRQQKLVDEYRDELAKVLELDPNHAPARLALGHQKQGGGWKSRDEVMAARGLVWYDGKYYTQHHIELLEQAKAAKQVDADWNNRLDRWRRWLTGRRQERSDEAQREIQALKDPAAAPAVVSLLTEEKDPKVKRLLMDVAAAMDTPQVLDALVQISLTDANDELRYAALDHLVATGRPGIAGPYSRALRSNDNVIVNRAAEALGTIGDRDAIGPLIGALVTKHKALVGSGSPDQHSYVFTPSGGTAMNMGSSGPKLVTSEVENTAVLAALSKLAGVNFGFDQARWRSWLTAEAKAHPVDVRRDQ